MKIVIDTSLWIEWLISSELGTKIDPYLQEKSAVIVPTIVQLELAKWAHREMGAAATDRILAYMTSFEVIRLTTDIAISAARLHRQFKLATADAVVYATAASHFATLMTSDAHFQGLPMVDYHPKLNED